MKPSEILSSFLGIVLGIYQEILKRGYSYKERRTRGVFNAGPALSKG